MNKIPDYLTQTSYQNPGSKDEQATLFQYANQTPLSFYEAMAANENVRRGFDMQMAAHIAMERQRFESGFAGLWDFNGQISPLIKSDEDVAIVDIGGSKGHVLEDVRKFLPGLKGRLILEELPSTLEGIQVPEGVEAVPYNFLEHEQPVKGESLGTGGLESCQKLTTDYRCCCLPLPSDLLELERRKGQEDSSKHSSRLRKRQVKAADHGTCLASSWGSFPAGHAGYADDADGRWLANPEAVDRVPGRVWFRSHEVLAHKVESDHY